MKTKLEYKRPSMRVVELKKQAPLICTSGKRQSYGTAIEEDWENE